MLWVCQTASTTPEFLLLVEMRLPRPITTLHDISTRRNYKLIELLPPGLKTSAPKARGCKNRYFMRWGKRVKIHCTYEDIASSDTNTSPWHNVGMEYIKYISGLGGRVAGLVLWSGVVYNESNIGHYVWTGRECLYAVLTYFTSRKGVKSYKYPKVYARGPHPRNCRFIRLNVFRLWSCACESGRLYLYRAWLSQTLYPE